MLRSLVSVLGAVVAVCSACGGATEANPADEPDQCFWSDAKLRSALARSGQGIYGTTTVSSCAAHCPPNFAAFCQDPGPITATSKGGARFSAVEKNGAYLLELAPGDYDVCTSGSCAAITIVTSEFRRIDVEATASPGGWYWTLRVR
jgi:hypothetical protein